MLFAVGRPHHETEFYHPALRKFTSHHSIDLEDFEFPEAANLTPSALCCGSSKWSKSKNNNDDEKDVFEVKVDVHNYRPEDLNVTTVDNYIVITGKHEEKQNDHGSVTRDTHEFAQRYSLPEGVKADTVTCKMCPDGMLRISVPLQMEDTPHQETKIPITFQEPSDISSSDPNVVFNEDMRG